MAVGIKNIHTISFIKDEQTKLLLLKSIILSHFQYPFLLPTGITSNPIDALDQQVNWALKTFLFFQEVRIVE